MKASRVTLGDAGSVSLVDDARCVRRACAVRAGESVGGADGFLGVLVGGFGVVLVGHGGLA